MSHQAFHAALHAAQVRIAAEQAAADRDAFDPADIDQQEHDRLEDD